MKKHIFLILITLSLYGCAGLTQKPETTNNENEKNYSLQPTVKQNFQNEETQIQANALEQQRILIYRKECQTEWDETAETVDRLSQSIPDITKEQAQNIAKNAGIADKNGYIIDKDIWIKNCIDKKIAIFE